MSEENRKIVIVIGAGASCDFVVSEDKKFNENHGDIKYEIWGNSQTTTDKDSDKNAKYFLSEKNRKNYSFPSGEALIKMIGDNKKITSFFWNEICESFRNVVIEKIKTTDQSIINFHNIFCDFLKDNKVKKTPIKLIVLQILVEFGNYLQEKVGEYKGQLRHYNQDNNVVRTEVKEDFYNFYKDFKPNDEDCSEDKKINKENCLFYKIIIANCNSRYLQISRLVNYYQPFSIDELLDSIKTEKIDVLEPLKIKKEDLKAILKSDEEDSKK
jgi:hypothetical protein